MRHYHGPKLVRHYHVAGVPFRIVWCPDPTNTRNAFDLYDDKGNVVRFGSYDYAWQQARRLDKLGAVPAVHPTYDYRLMPKLPPRQGRRKGGVINRQSDE